MGLVDLPNVTGQALSPSGGVRADEAGNDGEPAATGAHATLNVNGGKAVWFSSTTVPSGGIDVLCQHGRDDITPAPDGWTRRVDKHYG